MHEWFGTNISKLLNRSCNHIQCEMSSSDELWVHLNGDKFCLVKRCAVFIWVCVCVCFFNGYGCEKVHNPSCPLLFHFFGKNQKLKTQSARARSPRPNPNKLWKSIFCCWQHFQRGKQSSTKSRFGMKSQAWVAASDISVLLKGVISSD